MTQYLAEECASSGIEDIVFVVREGTRTIVDHFDGTRALELHLAENRKAALLEQVRAISELANFALLRQTARTSGNGSPILAVRRSSGTSRSPILFGDDLVLSETPCVRQLTKTDRVLVPSIEAPVLPPRIWCRLRRSPA